MFGLAGLAFAIVPTTAGAAVAVAAAGGAWVVTFATLNTAVQLSVPDWVRGRVLSIYGMAFTSAVPMGALVSGALAQIAGTTVAIAVMSVAVMGVAMATASLQLPTLAELERMAAYPRQRSPQAPSPAPGFPSDP